jgi:hypothetical protein
MLERLRDDPWFGEVSIGYYIINVAVKESMTVTILGYPHEIQASFARLGGRSSRALS